MKTNNSVRVGVNYTVQTLHDGMRGIIMEHWSGKSYPFWLERCDSGMMLYDTEAPSSTSKRSC